jgi:hypothetical protein
MKITNSPQAQSGNEQAGTTPVAAAFDALQIIKDDFLNIEETPIADTPAEETPAEEAGENEVLSQEDNSETVEEVVTDEAPEEPTEEEEATETEEDSAEEQPLPSDPKGVQKRIGKLARAKKEALAKIAELEAKLATKEQSAQPEIPQSIPQASQFSESLNSIQDINTAHSQAIEVLMWAEENPDGGFINNQEVTAEQVRAMKKTAMKRKEVEIPQRYQWLQAHEAAKAEAGKKWDWYNKPETPEHQAMQNMLRNVPVLKQLPNYPVWLGYMVKGVQAEQAQAKAKPVIAVPKKAPAVPATTNAIPKTEPTKNRVTDSLSNFYKAPSSDSALSYLKEII